MFALLGLGWGELVIIGIIGVLMIGVPIIVIAMVVAMGRRSRGADQIAELRAEVRWLREEVEHMKKGPKKEEPSQGITADGAK